MKLQLSFLAVLCLSWAPAAPSQVPWIWTDDLESYTPGILSPGNLQVPGQPVSSGGWSGWDLDPAVAGMVSTTFAHGGTQSLKIQNVTSIIDAIQPFNYNYQAFPTTGAWTFSVWQYLPSSSWSTATGESMLVLLNSYLHGSWQTASIPGPPSWAVQLMISANTSTPSVYDYGRGGAQVPLVFDAWKELVIKVDLDNDTVTVLYDNTQVSTGTYVQTVFGDGGGPPHIACLELYGNSSNAEVYYDDFSLTATPPLYQTNQAGSYLDINQTTSNGQTPVNVTVATGAPYVLQYQSVQGCGQPFDIGIETVPPLATGGGAWVTPGGQIFSLHTFINPAGTTWLNGGFTTGFTNCWGPALALTAGGAPADVYLQMIVGDPTRVDGFSLSAPCALHVRSQSTVSGPHTHNGWKHIVLADQPGAPPAVHFAGAAYTDIYVNSNGTITFGQPDLTPPPFTATVGNLQGGPPRFGVWSDWDSRFNGASITTTFVNQVITTTYSNVLAGNFGWMAGLPTSPSSSFTLEIHPPNSPQAGVWITNYAGMSIGHTNPTSVCMTPGIPSPGAAANGALTATNPGASLTPLCTFVGAGLVGAYGASDMITETVTTPNPAPSFPCQTPNTFIPTGLLQVHWPNADGASFQVW